MAFGYYKLGRDRSFTPPFMWRRVCASVTATRLIFEAYVPAGGQSWGPGVRMAGTRLVGSSYSRCASEFSHRPYTILTICCRWEKLNLVRVYTKPKGKMPDYSAPVVLRSTKCTVEDFVSARIAAASR